MIPGAPKSFRRRPLVVVSISALLFTGFGITAAAPAIAADAPCVGDTCDDGAWAVARGAANDVSYWGMSPGHNCTNYVAWRLIEAGAERPATHPGNSSDWAANALLDGYRVDSTPEAGAVAQWDSFAGGYGALGHVAYVEQVNDDGTILVAEDYWRDGQQLGPLTYRIVDPSSVSNFIHYGDKTDGLRTASLTDGFWTASGTGLDIAPTALTAVALSGGRVEIFYVQDGRLWQAVEGETGWTATDSGLSSTSTTLSAVSMNGVHPYVMSIEDDELVMNVRTDFGWQRMSTGLAMTGEIAAVNRGGLLPTVFISRTGGLWQAWGDAEGWHAEATSLGEWGSISALIDGEGRPVVFSAQNGMLTRFRLEGSEWRSDETAVAVTGRLAVTQTPSGSEIYVVEDGLLHRVRFDGSVWVKTDTALDGGAALAVVTSDEGAVIVQVG